MIVLQLVDTFPTFGERPSPEREASRAAAWLAANGDLPSDLWQEAKLGILRSDRKGMPSPGEFRALVQPQLDRRRRELERLREWRRRPPAKTPATETLEQRTKGLRDAYRRQRDHARAAAFEHRLAELEGRPVDFTQGELAIIEKEDLFDANN